MSLIYRYKISKFGITGGILPVFGLSAREIDNRKNPTTNETDTNEYKLRDFQRMDLGTKVEFDYQFAKNIRITASYYLGLQEIRKSEYFENRSKSRQVSIGVEYIFWKKRT